MFKLEFKPSKTALAGFSGVDKTLMVLIFFFEVSSTTISVKVPPISAETLYIIPPT